MTFFTCNAFAVPQPGGTFYVAAVRASEFASICRPLRRPKESSLMSRDGTTEPIKLSQHQLDTLVDSLESSKFRAATTELLDREPEQPYQRFLDENRALDIAKYLREPSTLLPNSVILAVNDDLNEEDAVRSIGNGLFEIRLPRDITSAVILDGQHRIAGFAYLPEEMRNELYVVTALLVGLPFFQQAEIFAIVNGKQKPVNRSIIYDLFGYAPIGGKGENRLYEGLMAVHRFCSHVARILNGVPQSPWHHKVKMRGPGDDGVISQAAIVDYLVPLVEPKKYSDRVRVLPLLFRYFKSSDAPTCASVIIVYLFSIRTALPDHWENSKSLLWKNNGVAVIFRILHDDLMLAGSSEALMDSARAITARWKKAPTELIASPPKAGGGGIQNQLYEEFRAAMFTHEEITKLARNRATLKSQLIELRALVE